MEQSLVTGNRDATTVPSQALFLLNSSFVRSQALALSERLRATIAVDHARIEEAYRQVLGRDPSPEELDTARAFLSDFAVASESLGHSGSQLAAAAGTSASVSANDTQEEELVLDPDQISQEGVPLEDEIVLAADDVGSAWFAFTQALFASAEFLYLHKHCHESNASGFNRG